MSISTTATDPARTTRSSSAGNGPGDILLDAGTNELEVLVFTLEGGRYGVNVAKVREVIAGAEPTETPRMHPAVVGMMNLRGVLVPLVDLKKYLQLGATTREEMPRRRVIVTEFNGLRVGFFVDDVDQIHRMSWERVRPAPELDDLGRSRSATVVGSCTGVIELNGHLVLMIDFESIADGVRMQDKLHASPIPNPLGVDRKSKKVVLVEDSPFMRDLMAKVLRESGYTQLAVYTNGADAWRALTANADANTIPDAIVSDIEMPQMDGLHLTKRIKEHAALKNVPVLLFSSLVSDDNAKKGQQVGANIQIPKPELPRVIQLVDQAVSGKLPPAAAAA